jgi:hypothetical protein
MSINREAQRVRRWMAVCVVLMSTGCGKLNAVTAPAPDRDWTATLATAHGLVAAGKFDSADSTLSSFAAMYPGTSAALETTYYRALFKMDPSNPHVSLGAAMASLDSYLADPRPRQRTVDAATLRRVAGQLDGLNHLATTAIAQAKDATNTAKDAKAQAADARDAAAKAAADTQTPTPDAEVKRLKDELAKANAELDRIRKRLATPPPPPK